MHDPQLLILDEPTDGVDPVGRSEMRVLLQGLKAAGKTIFINSHLLQEVELVCDRVAILDRGQVLHQGPISELTERADADVRMVVAGAEAVAARGAGRSCPWPRCVRWSEIDSRSGSRPRDQAVVDAAIDRLAAARRERGIAGARPADSGRGVSVDPGASPRRTP